MSQNLRQQIVISGLGGQGALTLTRLLAEAAAGLDLEVITSETHGMAQRGGTIISMVKVGPFRGPLIASGRADVGLFLHARNIPAHRHYLRPGGQAFINAEEPGEHQRVDASGLAHALKSPIIANIILLGYAAGRGGLFCGATCLEEIIRKITPQRFLDLNLRAFRNGLEAAGGHGQG